MHPDVNGAWCCWEDALMRWAEFFPVQEDAQGFIIDGDGSGGSAGLCVVTHDVLVVFVACEGAFNVQ